MAKINMIARDTKRKRLVDLHAAKRAELKKAGDSMGLQKLPKNYNTEEVLALLKCKRKKLKIVFQF